MAPRILVVDDDTALAEMIGIVLRADGFDPVFCADGAEAFSVFAASKPDLVLLDLMLPGKNGIEVCAEIRAESGVPVIMLTAKSDTSDVVRGLESGADDYVVKPFNPKELVARIRTRLRPTPVGPTDTLQVGDITVDVAGHEVTRGSTRIGLTPLEFELLLALARAPQQVFTREMLLEQVWGYHYKADTRLVNVHVQRLRAKVEEDPDNPRIVMTVRGVGYRAGAPPDLLGGQDRVRVSGFGDPWWSMGGWRGARSRVVQFWRTSLQFRTVATTVVLSGLAVGLIGAFMSVSIGGYLFSSRQSQIEGEAAGARSVAQQIIDNAQATGEANPDLRDLGGRVIDAVRGSTTSPGSTSIAIRRTQGQSVLQSLQPLSTQGFPDDVLTTEMRTRVAESTDEVLLQSVQLSGAAPGLVAGSRLNGPGSGTYELYLVYDLTDLQLVLGFAQRTLTVGLLSLVLLIGAVTYLVVRLVVAPVRIAAETSQRLAAGELEVRIPERGADVIATLARSFNAMADSLQEQIVKLAELSRLQQRFVSDVSHELRTPLTTIRLAGDVLYDERESFSATTGRTAELLHTQVDRFELLLADLLEISRYDAGAVELDLEPTNLVRLVEDAVESMNALAGERGSELRVVALGGYFEAEVDARRIRRILSNLLGNAVEHGEGRPVEVIVDSNETAIAIGVRDHGVGMSELDATKVFERFWRADPSRKRTIGGTGLGLAISLEDAVLHDGWLEVWSEPGRGSCFRLTLPRARGTVIAESPLELPPREPIDELEDARA